MSTESSVAELEFFRECLNDLATNLVKRDLGVRDHGKKLGNFGTGEGLSTDDQVQKSAWVASLLATSSDETYQSQALAYSVMSYDQYRGTQNEDLYRRYLYIVLSRLGSLPTFNNAIPTESELNFSEDLVQSLDSVLGLELMATKSEYKIDPDLVLSRFQKDVFDALREGEDVAISGPTSSGKSFILKRYIEHRLERDDDFEAIYVVPTRALISEVSRDLSQLHGDIVVRTGANFEEDLESDSEPDESTFLVVTPERCRKLIDPDVRGNIEPDLVFFDEVQNVEDDQRGVLFEGIVRLLDRFYPTAQIVAAGPYLENPGATLESLTNSEATEVQSGFTPVLQLRVSLCFNRGKGREITATIHSPSGDQVEIGIPEPDDLTYSDLQNKTESLPKVLEEFTRGEKVLVYSGQKNYAEKRAKRIAEANEARNTSPELRELKQFLSRTIHQDYSLIKCLDHGVAFHHGDVPKFARERIEDIYSETDELHTIVTTPTLMQGVNLPAEKIFLVGARRGNKDLTDFEFNNLVGRVGRLDSKLYGAIYCIEREDEEWADEKLENTGEKEIEPATSQAIGEAEKLITALQSSDLSAVEDASVRYTAILLRGKYLKNDDITEYLADKGMAEREMDAVEQALEDTLADIDVPERPLRQNPTVDPINLETLYNSVEEHPDQWTMGSNQYDETYDNLLFLARNLNRIFHFTNDKETGVSPEHVETEYGALTPIVVTATQWLQGQSYQSMIQERRDANSVPDDETIDQSIRAVMKIVDNDVCFILVKYFGILTSVLEEVHEDVPTWMLQFDRMLEMGSMHVGELKLMTRGVDRSVAVDLDIPAGVTEPSEYLQDNRYDIPAFHRKHLQNQEIL